MRQLTVEIVRKRFHGQRQPTLENLRLSAAAGEFLAIVGPSGAGKSTFLNIIAGLDCAFEGSVRLDDIPLRPADRKPQDLAFVFQEPRLMPWLTVLENLLLVMSTQREDRQRALELLTAVELREAADVYPHQLSGGMQRRCALARAFAMEPRLLLMDEPFVSLDAPTAERLRSKLLELWQRKRPTVLFVTHNLREALALADRVVFLSAQPGKVLFDFPITLQRPRSEEGAEVNELRDRLLRDHPGLLTGTIVTPDPQTTDRITA